MACNKCSILLELYQNTNKTYRDYWLMTEIFVLLHGSDVCDLEKGEVVSLNGTYGDWLNKQ